MKRIKIIALVAALCIAFGMTGCQPAGSGETTTEATTTEATTTEATTTETTEEPTTTTTTEATTTTTTEEETTTTTEEETTTTTTTEATTTTKKPKETKDTKATKDTKPSETKKDNKKDKYKGMSDFEIAESFIGKKAKDLIKVIGGKLEVVQACVDDVGMAIIKYKDFTVQCEQKTPNSDWIVTQVF